MQVFWWLLPIPVIALFMGLVWTVARVLSRRAGRGLPPLGRGQGGRTIASPEIPVDGAAWSGDDLFEPGPR